MRSRCDLPRLLFVWQIFTEKLKEQKWCLLVQVVWCTHPSAPLSLSTACSDPFHPWCSVAATWCRWNWVHVYCIPRVFNNCHLGQVKLGACILHSQSVQQLPFGADETGCIHAAFPECSTIAIWGRWNWVHVSCIPRVFNNCHVGQVKLGAYVLHSQSVQQLPFGADETGCIHAALLKCPTVAI